MGSGFLGSGVGGRFRLWMKWDWNLFDGRIDGVTTWIGAGD